MKLIKRQQYRRAWQDRLNPPFYRVFTEDKVILKRCLARYRAHPITSALIEGRLVPDWPRALDVVRQAARTTPFNPAARTLSW